MPARILPGLLRGRLARSYADLILESSPLAYWRCNEGGGASTLADSSGNGHTMTLNGTRTTGIAGKNSRLGNAVDWNAGSYGTVVDSSPFRLRADITLEAWVRFEAALVSGNICRMMHCVAPGETSATNACYQWLISDLGSGDEFRWFHEYSSGSDQVGGIGISFNATDWNHCVLRRDSVAKKWAAFINGVLQGEDSYTQNPTGGGSTNFQFGRNPATGEAATVDRAMDEVAVYSSALSDATIFEHYRAGRRAA